MEAHPIGQEPLGHRRGPIGCASAERLRRHRPELEVSPQGGRLQGRDDLGGHLRRGECQHGLASDRAVLGVVRACDRHVREQLPGDAEPARCPDQAPQAGRQRVARVHLVLVRGIHVEGRPLLLPDLTPLLQGGLQHLPRVGRRGAGPAEDAGGGPGGDRVGAFEGGPRLGDGELGPVDEADRQRLAHLVGALREDLEEAARLAPVADAVQRLVEVVQIRGFLVLDHRVIGLERLLAPEAPRGDQGRLEDFLVLISREQAEQQVAGGGVVVVAQQVDARWRGWRSSATRHAAG